MSNERPHRNRVRAVPETAPPAGWALWTGPMLVALIGGVFVVARITGFPRITPVTQLIAFYPMLIIAPLVIGIAATVRRRWLTAAASGSVVAVILLTSWPAGAGLVPAAADREQFRIVASNVYVGEATQALADALLASPVPPDLVVVEECTEECAAILSTEPMRALLPYRHIDAGEGARGGAILSATELTELSAIVHPVERDSDLVQPEATASLGGVAVRVKAAHPFPPAPAELGRWNADLGALADFGGAQQGPVIMAGDFNSTVYHQPFRAILGNRLRDALPPTAGTWPSDVPTWMAAPIDHILFSDPFEATASGTWDLEGSDHRTVWADLQIR